MVRGWDVRGKEGWPLQFLAAEGPDGAAFVLASPVDRADMRVIASFGGGWDHVSVSRLNRPPNWREMEYVRDLLFLPEECVVQYSVPRADNVNLHPNCLHLWRPQTQEIPMPPKEFV